MGKYETNTPAASGAKKQQKRQKKTSTQIVLVVVLSVFLAALLMMFVVPQLLYRLSNDPAPDVPEAETLLQEPSEEETSEITEPATEEPLPQPEALTFPIALENGNLTVNSVFSYTGIHPDKDGQDVSDLAAILVENTSGQYLKEAAISATLSNGTVCSFTVTDLPAGKTITLFAAEGETFVQDDFCTALSSEAVFEDIDIPEQLVVTAMGMDVLVENTSGEDLSNIDIYCRDTLGESYFGSTIYKHTIENLSAGQTATVTVSDSFVGMVEVVRIAINES